MAISFQDPHTFDPHLQASMFSGPIPGESFTHEYKSMPFQHAPVHTDLEKVMNHLMSQLLETEHLKQLLHLMEGGMSIEAITRTILFVGFATGQFTPDLGMLMYKPLMMSLIAIAKKAGMKDVPIVMKESLEKHMFDKMRMRAMVNQMSGKGNTSVQAPELPPVPKDNVIQPPAGGFFKRT